MNRDRSTGLASLGTVGRSLIASDLAHGRLTLRSLPSLDPVYAKRPASSKVNLGLRGNNDAGSPYPMLQMKFDSIRLPADRTATRGDRTRLQSRWQRLSAHITGIRLPPTSTTSLLPVLRQRSPKAAHRSPAHHDRRQSALAPALRFGTHCARTRADSAALKYALAERHSDDSRDLQHQGFIQSSQCGAETEFSSKCPNEHRVDISLENWAWDLWTYKPHLAILVKRDRCS
jgi:hypothetical protein